MIQVKDLHKDFGEKKVLRGITADFRDGICNLIIGQSGAGKTVLMSCIIGLFRPTSGQILFDGRDMISMKRKEWKLLHREVGMLFQGSALFDSMTVLENVRFPLDMFSAMNEKERNERAMYCLERVNLADAGMKYPGEISGGMQKRAAIARAISLNPKYLFCDEPNSGLDPKTSLVIDELIHSITAEYGITTIVNTHDMNSVVSIGDHILFLHQGQPEWQGTKDQVLDSKNENLSSFIFASDLFRQMAEDMRQKRK